MFLLVGCPFAMPFVFCGGQGHGRKKRTKTCNKETGEFHNQSRSINYVQMK